MARGVETRLFVDLGVDDTYLHGNPLHGNPEPFHLPSLSPALFEWLHVF